jgi:DNA polymerase-3 subunit epsilon
MAERIITLERPLVALDLETTGLDAHDDRIVELCCVKIRVDGAREVKSRRVNPGIPISPEATGVHGIRDEDVAHEPSFAQIARGLLAFLAGCDLTGFNIEHFDLPILRREFQRSGFTYPAEPVRVIDSWRIYLTQEPRDLSAAYRFYCGRELAHAHSAEADALAAADILAAQIHRYADLPLRVSELHDFCHPQHPDWLDPDGRIVWKSGEPVLSFGRHRDRSLQAIAAEEPDYLRWMMQSSFSDEVVSIIEAALRGDFPVRQAS